MWGSECQMDKVTAKIAVVNIVRQPRCHMRLYRGSNMKQEGSNIGFVGSSWSGDGFRPRL